MNPQRQVIRRHTAVNGRQPQACRRLHVNSAGYIDPREVGVAGDDSPTMIDRNGAIADYDTREHDGPRADRSHRISDRG